jgi:basic amino acid/polyamine antiporter, APA family
VAVTYARRLGLFSGTMSVIGGIIGSGIFLNPAIVAQRVGTPGATLAVWVGGGVVALIGAFVFGELGQRRPQVGGGYAYLREAFGPLPAFLYAWALLLIMAPGAIAAVAVTFANYTAALVGFPASMARPVAVAAILLLTVVNCLGVTFGAVTQNVFTLLKLAALAMVIVAGLGSLGTAPAACAGCAPLATPAGTGAMVGAVATALVPVLFAYGGWQQTNFIAEELIEPERNLPRALVLGVAAVVLVYVLANVAYLGALGVEGLAASPAPAADTMSVLLGPVGRVVITAGIACSTFGFLNLVILVTPRVFQAMAADGLFFERFARLHPHSRTPVAAIVFLGLWSAVLVYSGKYGALLDYVVFADWIFFGTTALTLIVFRRRDHGAETPFRLPGYPGTLWLFVAAAVYVVVGSVRSNPGNAARGLGLLALGVPVFYSWARSRARRGTPPSEA